MSSAAPRILYVTDLAYRARGRRYCDEDIFLTSRLRESLTLALCHPKDATNLMDGFDAVVVRNSGAVPQYRHEYEQFRERALRNRAPVYNQLSGKGDMLGKQHLVELTAAGYPVIPTVDRAEDLPDLPAADEYVVKPKVGGDSVGLRFLRADALTEAMFEPGLVAQPRVAFDYEVSFYFVDRDFQYALYAPDPQQRWQLDPYEPTTHDLEFAQRFVAWNDIDHGIQRVDGCRTPAGELLLVELEDLNPYLSLDRLDTTTRDTFVVTMASSLQRFLNVR
ncbi:MAG TPA: hypothetical protein VHG70_03430 [Nocardioidaceae bacterium]|nr:hypothetical protein [Nocardioidaceae bacterium]